MSDFDRLYNKIESIFDSYEWYIYGAIGIGGCFAVCYIILIVLRTYIFNGG